MDRRTEALRAVYDSIAERVPASFEAFLIASEDHAVMPIIDDGEIIGAALVHGNGIHVGVKRRPKHAHRGEFRAILGNLLRAGPVQSSVLIGNELGIEFCKRLGFEETHRDSVSVHLECRESRYV